MSTRTWQTSAAILVVLGAGMSSPAQAQFGQPVSPYINILRGGAPPAINYFNIVQPQLQFDSAIGQLQAQQSVQGQALAAGSALGATTGHPVLFGNYSHYYSARGMGTGGMGTRGGYGMGMGGMGMGMGGMGMGMGGMGMGMGMGGMGMGMGGMGMGGMGMGMGMGGR